MFDPQRAARKVNPDIDWRLSEFEEVFEQEDPWDYFSAYEERKYEETLALLPERVGSALEVGCAASSEGGRAKMSHPPPASTDSNPSTSASHLRSAFASRVWRIAWIPVIAIG